MGFIPFYVTYCGFHPAPSSPTPLVGHVTGDVKVMRPESLNASRWGLNDMTAREEKQIARLLVGMYTLSAPFSPGSETP